MAESRKTGKRNEPSSLTRLAADWYWEQDAQYRLTFMSGEIADKTGIDIKTYLGKRRWDRPALNLSDADWARHRAQLSRRQTFRDFEVHRLGADGASVWLSLSGEPVFGAKGRFKGYRGIGRDITRQKRDEQLLRLEHDTSRQFSEGTNTSESIRGALRAICENEAWECGRYLRLDQAAGVLRFGEAWSVRNADIERYVEASRSFTYAPGAGLVGIAWQTGQPVWAPDLGNDPRAARQALARETGMHGAFSVPVIVGGNTIGVLIFHSRAIREPDPRLLQAINVIATQIGQLMQRSEAQDAMRRFRIAMDNSADMIALIDRASMRYVDVNATLCRLLGYSREELLAMGPADLVPIPRATLERDYDALIANQHAASGVQSTYRCKDGTLLDFESARQVYRSEDRWFIVAISRDIRARIAAESALRESEERFRSLTELSTDFYWEQDAEYRFTHVEGRHVAGGDPELRRRLAGSRRWENGMETEGGWPAHIALLEARQPFRNALMWRARPEGTRYVRVSGEPVFDHSGKFTGYRGVGRDITNEKRAERLLHLEHRIAGELSEAEHAADGIRAVLRAICESEEWACGRHFALDESAGVLRFRDGWSSDPGFQELIDGSRDLTFKPGSGLAGRVLQDGEPIWTADARTDPRIQSQPASSVPRVHGTFVFALASEGRRIGVLSFSSREVRLPDQRLLQAARVIGSQVGQFLQRKKAEEALRESEARFRSLTQMSSDFFWETDDQHRFTQLVHGPNYKERFARLIIGKTAWDLPSGSPGPQVWADHRDALARREPFRDFEFSRPRAAGKVRHLSISGEPRVGADGTFLGYRGVGRDITDIVLARDHIASLAYNDPLTGLANRTSFLPSFEQAVERARRRAARIATMFLDLDGFKELNDRHGHEAGDRFLVEVARRLRASLRASDLVARLGGDEFFMVLEDQQEANAVESVACKLLAEIFKPFDLGAGEQASVSGSIGISIYPDDAADAPTLMKQADTAMYRAKQAGKNAFSFFRESLAEVPARTDA